MNKSIISILSTFLMLSCTGHLPQKVDYPYYAFRNTFSQELVCVERTDTATILSFKSFYKPHWWITVDPEAYLTDGKARYALKGTEGITPGEHLYMDDNGNAEYKLSFEPIPETVSDISYIETEKSKRAFNFYHIDLSGKTPKPLKDSERLPDCLPEVLLKSGTTTVDINLTCSLVGLPSIEVKMYANTIFPLEQQEYTGLMNENGKASFCFDLYSPGQALLVIADKSYGPFFLEPGESFSVTVDGSDRQRTIQNFSLDEVVPARFVSSGKYAAVNNIDKHEKANYNFNAFNGSFAGSAETMSDFAAVVCETYNQKMDALAAADTLSPFMRDYLREYIISQTVEAIAHANSIRRAQYYHTHNRDDSGYVNENFTEGDVAFMKNMDLNSPQILLFGIAGILGPDICSLLFPEGTSFQSDYAKAYPICRKVLAGSSPDTADLEILDSMSSPIYKDCILALQKANEISLNAMPDCVKDIPDVPTERLLDTILAQYKGQVVLVDCWATWCVPCREGHRIIEPLKDNRFKDVTFIYFTSTTSPLPKWREMITNIRGDHYYFTEEQWKSIEAKIESNAYPTYLIVGRDGKIKNKFIGYDKELLTELDKELKQELEIIL